MASNATKQLQRAQAAFAAARSKRDRAEEERDAAREALQAAEAAAVAAVAEGGDVPDLGDARRRLEGAGSALRIVESACAKALGVVEAAELAVEAETQERLAAEHRAAVQALADALEVAREGSEKVRALRDQMPHSERVPQLHWRELGGEGSRLHAWRASAQTYLEPPAPRPVQGVRVRMLVTNRDRRWPFRERNAGEVRTLSEADAARLVEQGVAEHVA
jgi:hypothetical protein